MSYITINLTVCSTVCFSQQQRKHQNCPLLALCEGNPPVTGGFPSQRASNVESVSISYHHDLIRDDSIHCNRENPCHDTAKSDQIIKKALCYQWVVCKLREDNLTLICWITVENIHVNLYFYHYLALRHGADWWNIPTWKTPFICLTQYHGCWCPGDTRSQGISSHDINLVLLE